MGNPSLPTCFRDYPGIVLHLDAAGEILDSNGRLEALFGGRVVGRPLVEFLDASSSGEKLRRLLNQVAEQKAEAERNWEFVLRGTETLQEPRAFSLLHDEDAACLWLIEHPRDPRFDRLRSQVIDSNTELSNTQRELLKERSELAATLSELEEEQRISAGLMDTIREQNAELQRSNRALDEFARAISHDLKAPLRNIGRYSEILQQDLADRLDDESAHHLERQLRLVGRLKSMIDGVLEFSRVGRRHEEVELLHVGEMVDRISELVDPDGTVTIQHDGMPRLVTESAPLEQVLLNLISNGARYAEGPSPTVRVDARLEEGFYHFRVADTGPGIPESMRDRIWHLFQTLEPSSPTQGTGIGLAIVKRQVEEMGGRVWVDSEAGGATFHFTWPAEPAKPSETAVDHFGGPMGRESKTSG